MKCWLAIPTIILCLSCLTEPFKTVYYSHGVRSLMNGDPQATDPEPTHAFQNDVEAIAIGEDYYKEFCADCHGKDGDGNGNLGVELRPPPADLTQVVPRVNDQQLFRLIAFGQNNMPTWREILSDGEIWAIVVYLKSRAAKPDPADSQQGASPQG